MCASYVMQWRGTRTLVMGQGTHNHQKIMFELRKPFARFDHECALRMDFSKYDNKSEFS